MVCLSERESESQPVERCGTSNPPMHARGRPLERVTVGLLGAETAWKRPNQLLELFWLAVGKNTSTAPYAGWRRARSEAGDVEDVHGTDGPPVQLRRLVTRGRVDPQRLTV